MQVRNLISRQLLNKLKIGTASRQALSRDNSNISSGATSYHTAQQYQNSSNENVVEQTYYTRPRTTLNVPGPSTRYQIPSYSQLHEETGDRPTSPIPIPRPRPRRQFLDLEGACAEGADLDRQKVEKKLKGEKATANIQARPLVHSEQSTGVVVQPSRLATYLTQGHKVEHCDIKEWVNDSIDAQESACSAVKKPVRQCKEYYMTENFNPLNVHRQSNYDEERKDKNMAFGLAQARRNPKTLAARKIELSRREEVHMLRAQMAEEASLAAEAYETEKARKKAEAQKAGGARTTQAYKANEIQNPELSQLADEVSDMHITTEAVASQAPDGLIRGIPKNNPTTSYT